MICACLAQAEAPLWWGVVWPERAAIPEAGHGPKFMGTFRGPPV